MAEKSFSELIKALEAADLKTLAENMKAIASNAANAQKAAKDFIANIQKGMKEQEAIQAALKTGYADLVDSDNKAAEAANTRAAALKLVQASIDRQKVGSQDLLKATQNLTKENSENLKLTESSTKNLADQADHFTKLTSLSKDLGTNMKTAGIGADAFSTLTKGAADIFSNIVDGAQKVGSLMMGGLPNEVQDLLAPAAGAFAAWKVMENAQGRQFVMAISKELMTATEELNNTATGFRSLTGQVMRNDLANKNLEGRLIALQRDNRGLGATVKDLGEAMQEAGAASRTFGMLMGTNQKQNRRQIDALTEMTFRFKKVGLGAENFGKALDVLGNTYGRTDIVKKGKQLGAELVNIGRVTGQTADVVATNFSVAMENLAAYSLPKARDEFKKLSAISAVTGVEMGTLMTIAGQYDNMEEAADAVGSLNAMMGGPYLNTLDLVNATESERVDMLKEMMTQSGETFNTMDRFKQKAIAQALGTDVQNASRLFTGSQKEIDSTASSIDKQGASYSQLSKAAAISATSIKDQTAAMTQSGLLVKKLYDKTIQAQKEANYQLTKFGDLARKNIEVIGGRAIASFNTDIKKMGSAINKFAETGKLSDVLNQDTVLTMAKYGFLGGKEGVATADVLGSALQDQDDRILRDQERGRAGIERNKTVQGIIRGNPEPPASVSGQKEVVAAIKASTKEEQDYVAQITNAVTSVFAKVTTMLSDPTPTVVHLNVDGQKIAEVATGLTDK
jgi:hypothetical protein